MAMMHPDRQSEFVGNAMAAALDVVEQAQLAARDVECGQRLARLRHALKDSALRVVVFGEFNRGKSTLINALVGHLVLPAGLAPTTGHVTRLALGERDSVRIHCSGGQVENGALVHFGSLAALNDAGFARTGIEMLEVAVNSAWLPPGMALIDTPGLSNIPAQTMSAKTAIEHADVAILLLDARRLLGGHERELAVEWLIQILGKPLIPVVNFMNFVTTERDVEELRLQLDRWSLAAIPVELDRPWFEINAISALRYAVGEAAAPSDDFIPFRKALSNAAREKRAVWQRQARCGLALAELRDIRRLNEVQAERICRQSEQFHCPRGSKGDESSSEQFALRRHANTALDRAEHEILRILRLGTL